MSMFGSEWDSKAKSRKKEYDEDAEKVMQNAKESMEETFKAAKPKKDNWFF